MLHPLPPTGYPASQAIPPTPGFSANLESLPPDAVSGIGTATAPRVLSTRPQAEGSETR
ncbi:Uncharacterised protein [Amycolatopsis camponoti]|uniref:Uncharacterized protein n=1 Tax=Amycolatopsis camponoti TaxID=2606593 RepID=A0A6I8LWW0_9PSEU|nr:hypothetical protein [Amycolatopsis camponoti]VVJ22668.1 Uncharacterised protein [Amycolatopsis camponoti]